MYQMSITATPTLAPTPTPVPATPTPDTRGIEKLFSDAQQAYLGGNWTLAIETLLTLRKRDANFNAVQVDDMLFVALRYRGLDKIKGSGKTDPTITQVDLEGGMYDLKLAENFGPLDVDALKYRRWAQWYIAGSSFWNVDWKRVVDYFALVASEAPYLVDVNNWPAIERYRYALIKYGDQLAAAGDCAGASEQYQKALALGPNPDLEPTATAVVSGCGPGEPEITVEPGDGNPSRGNSCRGHPHTPACACLLLSHPQPLRLPSRRPRSRPRPRCRPNRRPRTRRLPHRRLPLHPDRRTRAIHPRHKR